MLSFLEPPARIQSSDKNELTEISYEVNNVTEHFATDFQEFKASNAERIDKIERLIWENVMVHDTVPTEDMNGMIDLGWNPNPYLRSMICYQFIK